MTNTIDDTKESTPTVGILSTLGAALSAIQAAQKDVPSALAVVIATGQGKKHGHFETNAWVDTAGAHEGSARHEILMSSESLGRGGLATFVTLLHESAHAANHATGTKDTSRQGRWHNGAFRSTAESFGLVVEENSQIGHVTTGLQSWALDFYAPQIDALNAVLTTHRKLEAKKPTKKTTIKVGCECVSDKGNALTVSVPIKWYVSVGEMTCDGCEAPLLPVGE